MIKISLSYWNYEKTGRKSRWTVLTSDSALYKTALNLTQCCPGQLSFWLSAVWDSYQNDSVFFETAVLLTQRCLGQPSVWLSTVRDSLTQRCIYSKKIPWQINNLFTSLLSYWYRRFYRYTTLCSVICCPKESIKMSSSNQIKYLFLYHQTKQNYAHTVYNNERETTVDINAADILMVYCCSRSGDCCYWLAENRTGEYIESELCFRPESVNTSKDFSLH